MLTKLDVFLLQLYFIDHNSRTTTFIDPRLPVEETLPRRNRSESEVLLLTSFPSLCHATLLTTASFTETFLSNRSEENVAFSLAFIANICDENISCEKFDIIYVIIHCLVTTKAVTSFGHMTIICYSDTNVQELTEM